MYRVSYRVAKGVEMYKDCTTLADTFETVKALIMREKINFPDQELAIDSYLEIIGSMAPKTNGRTTMHENALFRMEVVKE